MALAAAKRIVPLQAVQVWTGGSEKGGYAEQRRRETDITSSGSSTVTQLHRADSSGQESSQDNEFGENACLRQGSSLSVLESALEAWIDCQLEGYTMPENLVPSVLDKIAPRVSALRSGPNDSNARAVRELFSTCPDVDPAVPRFQRMLTVYNGFVHFLHFWNAFSQAVRYCGSGGSKLNRDEMLAAEFEILRDGILQAIGEYMDLPSCEVVIDDMRLQSNKLIDVVQGVASRSCSPGFWNAVARTFAGTDDVTLLNLDDLTVLILCWHRDAIAWQHERTDTNSGPVYSSESESREDTQQKNHSSNIEASNEVIDFRGGLPVYVHIYDVSQEDSVKKFNKYMASRYSPVKFGGIFHAGVEVNGLEWSYGVSFSDTVPGLSCIEPKTHPAHSYRQTVQLRHTKMNGPEIADLISQLIEEYPGDDYCLLRRNCCHFADDFCKRLGAGRLPGWVHRLARLGARVDGALQLIGRQLPMMSAGDSSSDEDY